MSEKPLGAVISRAFRASGSYGSPDPLPCGITFSSLLEKFCELLTVEHKNFCLNPSGENRKLG